MRKGPKGMAKKKASRKMQYWLFKTEPTSYSIDDLARDQTTFWDGVRNYQVRNMLRDEIQTGDKVFFYHSNAKPPAIMGTAEVVKPGYADHTQFDPNDHHYDEKADPDDPTWFMVDIKFLQKFPEPVDREMLAGDAIAKNMGVLAKGSRLSILPVTAAEWKAVHKLAGVKEL
jgi:predicted RNA-binding protein with PUA-like domain